MTPNVNITDKSYLHLRGHFCIVWILNGNRKGVNMVDADANKAGRPGLSLGGEQQVGRAAPRHTDLVDNEVE